MRKLENSYLTEKELILSCKKNNRKAQKELYEIYKERLFLVCLKYCRNKAEAEDNLHDTFVEVFLNIKKYKFKGSFEGWLKRIAINKAISLYKNKKEINVIFYDSQLKEEEETKLSEFNDLPLQSIINAIQKLPNQYRLVFSLYYLDGYSHKEVSEKLDISISTSKSNLHRAKIHLRENLNNSSNLKKAKRGA
ncbi:RNA polymerase sigma-70 factor, ECF subfamily [Mesonia phycicola]|uniref:RNA polymerase sigma-70 factor, ECF subfamily n=1 Tax=Mesonia phycicola TaxID=579105 RepID=A0A1M6GLA1_9FLAO|nr:RNA polymerase sigma factor [Mesonia phycicola]SHJ10727.1 RNA polymerase sigma-70 factor, ECF subfamily [Mesonia phycicola]